jgi:DNA polymerase III sliding clamp (beta) subunit (PCNA family)
VDVNAKYLLDAIGDGEVTIETSGVLDPITVRDGNVLSVAMPMRVGR